MNEPVRIVSLFNKLYNSNPWIDVNIVDTLSNLTADQAAKKVLNNCNSIWEITNHIIDWRLNVLQRIQGKVIKSTANNYFYEIKEPTPQAWQDTINNLAYSQAQWIELLAQIKSEDYEKKYPVNDMTYYEHIQGIIQHDAYHLGQIVLLKKLL